jgi:hypothetical protein
MKEEDLSKNEVVGLFTRMVDADLMQWLSQSKIDFVRDYVSRIRYRHLFKVVLSRPLVSFGRDIRTKLLGTLGKIGKLVEIENELSEEPGRVILDLVVPKLGEKELTKIPLLVGGEGGLDLVPLDETEEGRPLIQLLKQQARTIPSVRVYSDPDIAPQVRRTFEKEFPLAEKPNYRDDQWDLTEY